MDKLYSRENVATLPTDDIDLATIFSASDYTKVTLEDSDYVEIS